MTASVTPGYASTPSASAGTTLDQEASFGTPGSSAVGSGQRYAQTFTVGLCGSLTQVALGLAKDNDNTRVPAYLTIGIYQSSSDVPTGSALASTAIRDFTAMPTESEALDIRNRRTLDVEFTSPTAVTAGSTYAIVAEADNNGEKFSWYNASAYDGGEAAYNDRDGG